MLLLVMAVYALCAIAFYVQMLMHGKHHFELDEATAPPHTAEIIELFPATEVQTKAA